MGRPETGQTGLQEAGERGVGWLPPGVPHGSTNCTGVCTNRYKVCTSRRGRAMQARGGEGHGALRMAGAVRQCGMGIRGWEPLPVHAESVKHTAPALGELANSVDSTQARRAQAGRRLAAAPQCAHPGTIVL